MKKVKKKIFSEETLITIVFVVLTILLLMKVGEYVYPYLKSIL